MRITLKTPVQVTDDVTCTEALVRVILTQTATTTLAIHVIPIDVDGNTYPAHGINHTENDIASTTLLADCGKEVKQSVMNYLTNVNIA